jgi:hypothetical protein
MSTPQPIDVSRLKGILGNAKKIMGKVETGNYETGHVDSRALTEDGVKQLQAEGVKRPAQYGQQTINYQQPQQGFGGYSENVLKAMMKDVLIEYLSNEYSKNLTETVIKQTINTLINEGKITTKKKV